MKEPNTENNPNPAPCACAASPAEVSRRKFLERFSILLGSFGAAVLALPMVGFIFAPLFERDKQLWRSVGEPDSFKMGETKVVAFEDSSPLPWAGVTARTAAYVRRVGQESFIAFSLNCTHLGCPVRWLEGAKLFMCPCHGGVYYEDGSVAAGPPPLPLPRYQARVYKGQVQILTAPTPISTK